MELIDYIILIIYAAGILLIGGILSKRNKTSDDMFAVRKQSPWWLSGLSAFMSAFSAGTFVVWGGIAYKQGLVAVSILMCSGIASFLVGKFFAKKWASLNISTVGEYVSIRFGQGAVQFYTWVGMLFKIIAMGVALYSFAVVVASLIPLSPDNWLVDTDTHKLSVSYTIIISGLLMLMYAVSGGLWAVLIIDAVQFVVLTMTVLFVVPLSIYKVGGMSSLIDQLPKDFLSPVSGNFTWLFLLGWVIVHTFKLGGEWVFVQRFLAVSSPKNARKSSNLFGWLYIISPIIWMLPPIIYRVAHPGAAPEQAYIMACAWVLPPGLMGLLVAAMFSSAASYIDGEINVYAAAITNSVYKDIIAPEASEKQVVFVGRLSSLLIGLLIMAIAVCIPYFGGAEQIILTITGLLVVAMVLPMLWGLYFGKIKQSSIWWSTGITVLVSIALKGAIFIESDNFIMNLYHANNQLFEVAVGIFVPLTVLAVMELGSKTVDGGFVQIEEKLAEKQEVPDSQSDFQLAVFPAQLLGYSIGVLAVIMFGLMLFSTHHSQMLIGIFAAVLLILSAIILLTLKFKNKKNLLIKSI
ncbi:Na+:solute symporter [Flavobacterium circumlabens]|uniref:Na+/proline symporter n=1 Tax=Flavobacterium circumlabens TaxID=2133765 RepID=A0A4Y7UED4_9FLAO|nr:Na+:solute symporter [Flavobacterium circumlabens]TCN59523.1 Na+/proline symporter [Flavobacterium circumlabens]TEB44815.1 Na+:solute symporter [Flavobacterium circumlabens]